MKKTDFYQPLDQKEFRKVLFRALLFPLVSAFLLALLIAWQIRALLDMTAWVDRSQQVISQSHRVQKLLIDMETGVRGYALTGAKEYLAPYREARSELDSALSKMASLLEDQPEEGRRLAKISALAKEWIVRYSDVTIDRFASGRKLYDPNIGQTMMTEMRTQLAQLIQSAAEMREERVDRARSMARILSGGGVLLALSIGFFLAMSARRHIFHLSHLYQRSLEERNQLLSREQHRSGQLQSLAELAVALNTTVKLEDRLDITTKQALQIIGARQALTSLGQEWKESLHSVSLAGGAPQEKLPAPESIGLERIVCEQNRSLRLSPAELPRHSAWNKKTSAGNGYPPLRGWLAAPLIGQDGKNLGLVQLSDKIDGDFSAEDEFILVQIAQIAAVAVENSRLFEAEQEAVRTRDEFLSIASHELKTPLTSLRLQVQLIEKALGNLPNESRQKLAGYLKQSLKSMDRITHLVDDMLDISRISVGRLSLQKERFDLTTLTREVADRLSPLAQQSACTLHFDSAETVCGEWDRFRLDQVITNLIGNALKYGAGHPIGISVAREGKDAVLTVRDQGIGIAPEHQERIFQRFERVGSTESVSGMGLGLYIARQIVDMHEGQMTVNSELGKGAAFSVRLPSSPQA